METVLLVVTIFTLNGAQIDLKKSVTMTHVTNSFAECEAKEKVIRARLIKENQPFLSMCRAPRLGEAV